MANKFKVGDLVVNGWGKPEHIVIEIGDHYVAWKDKPWKFRTATFLGFDGRKYTISALEGAWQNHKVVANG